MRMKSVLKNHHDLKKNGYNIIRKLHKLETKDGVNRAYRVAINNSYYCVLSCKALVDILRMEYPEAQEFGKVCDAFLSHLDSIAARKSRIDKSKLARFLHAYTCFFNEVIDKKRIFIYDQAIIDAWNIRCLMAYVAAWETNKRN